MTGTAHTTTTRIWTAYITLLRPRAAVPDEIAAAVAALLSPSAIEHSRDTSWGYEELEAPGGCEHFRPLAPLLMAREMPFNISDQGTHGVAGRHIWWEPGMRFPEVEIQRSW